MAVVPSDLIQPQGPVSASFFPDDAAPPAVGDGSVLGRLDAYIARAVTKVTPYGLTNPDPAVRDWALHLAFEDAYLLMASRPANETALGGLGSVGYSSEQLKALARKSEEYREAFIAEIAAAGPTALLKYPVSRTTRNVFDW